MSLLGVYHLARMVFNPYSNIVVTVRMNQQCLLDCKFFPANKIYEANLVIVGQTSIL